MKYAIFSGEYSDWYVCGYFENEEDADKYCAVQNNGKDGLDGDLKYVVKLTPIVADLRNVNLHKQYVFYTRFEKGLLEYREKNCYLGDKKKSEMQFSDYGITFSITASNQDVAMKIAQDKYAEIKHSVSEGLMWFDAIILHGGKHEKM